MEPFFDSSGIYEERGTTPIHIYKEVIIKIHKKRQVCITYLRPDHSLEDGVQLIWGEAVGVKAVKEVLDPQDAESPQVLQRTDATCPQLQMKRRITQISHEKKNVQQNSDAHLYIQSNMIVYEYSSSEQFILH